jgi:hypothetical protein
MRRLLPLHDDTAAIACTASPDELPVRLEAIARLRTHLDRVERTEHGLLLHLPNRPEVADDLARFTVDEKACCQFWGFAIDVGDDTITFRWDGPRSVDHVLDRLLDFFRSDAPLTALDGVLSTGAPTVPPTSTEVPGERRADQQRDGDERGPLAVEDAAAEL